MSSRRTSFPVPVFIVFGIIFAGIIAFTIAHAIGHAEGIHAGSVTDKNHTSAYNSCSGSGSHRHCTWHSAHWDVTIAKGDKHNEFRLSHSDWDNITIGQRIRFNGDTLVK